MSLTITGDTITSDLTDARAIRQGSREGWDWDVSGYADRAFTRNQAITAMTIAEERAKDNPNQALIESLLSEL